MVIRPLLACLVCCAALGCAVDTGGLGARADGGRRDGATGEAGASDAPPADDAGVEGGSRDAGPSDAGCGAAESCGAPIDEDCDGVVDEGCSYYFGRPSPLVRLHVSENQHYSPVLSTDGLRLYYYAAYRDTAATPRGALRVATRPSPSDRFGPPAIVGGFEDVTPFSFTLSDDELEIVAEVLIGDMPTRLVRATRESRTAAFGDREALTVLESGSTTRELNPHLSRDGRELLFVSNRSGPFRVYRSTRVGRGMPFTAPEPVELGEAEYYTPALTRDGLTLFVSSMNQFWTATRPTTADPFGPLSPLAGLPSEGAMIFPFVSQATSEIFFTSSRPWSPALRALWRARICREGPCTEPSVPCDEGTRSPDQRHCYFATGANGDVFAARSRCAAVGATLPTLHSAQERDLLRGLTGGIQWTAGNDEVEEGTFVWETGEPWLYAPWQTDEPDGGDRQNFVELRDTSDISDAAPTDANDIVCERELSAW